MSMWRTTSMAQFVSKDLANWCLTKIRIIINQFWGSSGAWRFNTKVFLFILSHGWKNRIQWVNAIFSEVGKFCRNSNVADLMNNSTLSFFTEKLRKFRTANICYHIESVSRLEEIYKAFKVIWRWKLDSWMGRTIVKSAYK